MILAVLAATSVWHVDWQLARFADPTALARLGDFVAGLLPPPSDVATLRALAAAALETLSMSLLGTLGAVPFALPLALLARAPFGTAATVVLAIQRAVPELVWATLLIVAVGLGPVTGTLALCAHTIGTLGRLYAETLAHADTAAGGPTHALRANGASRARAFLWGTLPVAAARLSSHTLYRLEANVRAAAVLGVVGAGGLGQRLYVETSLFRLDDAAATVLTTLLLVCAVDGFSHWARRRLAG